MPDGTTIDSLQIQISAEAGNATKSLEALASTLGKFREAARGGLGLSAWVNGIKSLGEAARSISSGSFEGLNALVNALKGLQGVGKFSISSTIAKQLKEINSALTGMDTSGFGKLAELGTGLSAFGSLKISGTVAKQIKEIAAAAAELNGKDFSGIANMADALRNLSEAASGLRGAGGALTQLSNSAERAATPMAHLGNAARNTANRHIQLGAKILVAYKAVQKLSRGIASLIDKSNKYVEDLNLFNVSLGEYADEAQEYADKVASIMGIDPANWMRNQGVFQILAEGFGVASDRAYIMSKNLTQLGYDLSSFYNIAVEGEGGAMQKLQAAISGELEPIRRLGFDLSEARLKAIALSLGIDQTFNSMTQAQKAQLRYYAILTQVTDAQGDMARTLETPANQLRILKAQFEQAARAIGNIFIPALNAILPYAIAAVNAIRMVADAIADFFGFALPEVDYSGVTSATAAVDTLDESLQSAGGSAKKLNELLADWDELNIIQSESGGGGGKGNSAFNPDDWAFALPEYDFLKGLTESRAAQILDKLKPGINWVKDHIESILKLVGSIGGVFVGWKLTKFLEQLTSVHSILGKIFGAAGIIAIDYASIKLNYTFMKDFLETGDWAELLAGITVTEAGAILTEKIAKSLFKGTKFEGLASIVGGIPLLINGIIDMSLAIGDILKNGFDTKNITLLVAGSGLAAIGGIKIIKPIAEALQHGKLTAGQTFGVGLGTIFFSAGIALGGELTKGYLAGEKPEEIWKSFASDVSAALGTGVSLGAAFKNQRVGVGAAGASLLADGMVDFFMTAGDIREKGVTKNNMITLIKTTLESLTGGTMLLRSAFGRNLQMHKAIGAAAALIGGIQLSLMFNDGAAELDKSTEDEIVGWAVAKAGATISDLTSGAITGAMIIPKKEGHSSAVTGAAFMMGLNSSISLITTLSENYDNNITPEQWEKMKRTILVDTAKSAVGFAVAGSYFGPWGMAIGGAVGLILGIATTLKLDANVVEVDVPREPQITWGKTSLSEEQIEEYVAGFYTFDLRAHVASITAYADERTALHSNVSGALTSLQLLVPQLTTTLDRAATLKEISKVILGENGEGGEDSLMYQIQELISKNKIPVESLFSLDGKLSGNERDTLEAMTNVESGVQTTLSSLGETWGQWFKDGFEGVTDQMIEDLLGYMSDLTSAYTRGKNEAKFKVMMANLDFSDMDQESVMEVLKKYQEDREELWNSYKQEENEAYENVVADLKAAQVQLAHTQKGTVEYTQLKADIDRLQSEADELYADITGGYKEVKKTFDATVKESDELLATALLSLFTTGSSMTGSFTSMFTNAFNNRFKDQNFATYEEGEKAVRDYFTQNFQSFMQGYFGTEAWTELAKVLPNVGTDLVSVLTDYLIEDLSQYGWLSRLPHAVTGPTWQTDTSALDLLYSSMPERPNTPPTGWDFSPELTSLYAILNSYRNMADAAYSSGDYDELERLINIIMYGTDALNNFMNGNNQGGADALESMKAAVEEYEQLKTPVELSLDVAQAEYSLETLVTASKNVIDRIKANFKNLHASINVTTSAAMMGPMTYYIDGMAAAGGTFDVGEMFVAREAGPEMVGRIGRHTAVANNDQIVEGISGGVSEANEEQNALLRQQNQYLRALLNKQFKATVEPTTALARTLKRSNEMLLQADGQ